MSPAVVVAAAVALWSSLLSVKRMENVWSFFPHGPGGMLHPFARESYCSRNWLCPTCNSDVYAVVGDGPVGCWHEQPLGLLVVALQTCVSLTNPGSYRQLGSAARRLCAAATLIRVQLSAVASSLSHMESPCPQTILLAL